MTVTYDPRSAVYLDEADTRLELARVFDICARCRRCIALCDVFPELFSILDAFGDASLMTPSQQDGVLDLCHRCSACVEQCPYRPGLDARQVNVLGAVERGEAMRRASGQIGLWRRVSRRWALRAARESRRPAGDGPESRPGGPPRSGTM